MSLVPVDEIYNQISTIIAEKDYSIDNVVSIAKKVVKLVMEYKDYNRDEQSKLVQAVMKRVVDESNIPDGIKIQLNFGLQLLLPDIINMAFKYYDNKTESQNNVPVVASTVVAAVAAPVATQEVQPPNRNNDTGCKCIIA